MVWCFDIGVVIVTLDCGQRTGDRGQCLVDQVLPGWCLRMPFVGQERLWTGGKRRGLCVLSPWEGFWNGVALWVRAGLKSVENIVLPYYYRVPHLLRTLNSCDC